jgi:hypothetical protein
MGIGHGTGERTDPLEQRFVGKSIVLAVLLVVVVAFVFSARRPDPVPLPGVALDSPFLLDMERAAVVAAFVVGATVFLIRGWVGYFPSKLSTTGAEYESWRGVDETSGGGDGVRGEVAALWAHQVDFARMAYEVLDEVVADIDALHDRIPQSTEASKEADML